MKFETPIALTFPRCRASSMALHVSDRRDAMPSLPCPSFAYTNGPSGDRSFASRLRAMVLYAGPGQWIR